MSIKVGCRAKVTGKLGTVKFIGNTQFGAGEWVGVELDTPDGKNDGTVNGVAYFDCKDQHGLFVRKIQVKLFDESAPATSVASRRSSVGTSVSKNSSSSAATSTASSRRSSIASSSSSSALKTPSTKSTTSSSRMSIGGSTSSSKSTSKSSTTTSKTSATATRTTRTSLRLSGSSKADIESDSPGDTKKKTLSKSSSSTLKASKSSKSPEGEAAQAETGENEKENDDTKPQEDEAVKTIEETPVKLKAENVTSSSTVETTPVADVLPQKDKVPSSTSSSPPSTTSPTPSKNMSASSSPCPPSSEKKPAPWMLKKSRSTPSKSAAGSTPPKTSPSTQSESSSPTPVNSQKKDGVSRNLSLSSPNDDVDHDEDVCESGGTASPLIQKSIHQNSTQSDQTKIMKLESEVQKLKDLLNTTRTNYENERLKTLHAQETTKSATKAATEAQQAAAQATLNINRALKGEELANQELLKVKLEGKEALLKAKQDFEQKAKDVLQENADFKLKVEKLEQDLLESEAGKSILEAELKVSHEEFDTIKKECQQLEDKLKRNKKEVVRLKRLNHAGLDATFEEESRGVYNSDDDDDDDDFDEEGGFIDRDESMMASSNKALNRSGRLNDLETTAVSDKNHDVINLKNELRLVKENLSSSDHENTELRHKITCMESDMLQMKSMKDQYDLDKEELELKVLEVEIENESLKEFLDQERSINGGGSGGGGGSRSGGIINTSFSSLYGSNQGNDEDGDGELVNKDEVIANLQADKKNLESVLCSLDQSTKQIISKLQESNNNLSDEIMELETSLESKMDVDRELQECSEKYADAMARLELLADREDEFEIYAEEKYELEQQISKLKKDLLESKDIIDEADEHRELLEETEEVLQESLRLLGIRFEDSEAMNRDLAANLSSARAECDELRKTLSRTETTLVSVRKRRDEALSALASTQQEQANIQQFGDMNSGSSVHVSSSKDGCSGLVSKKINNNHSEMMMVFQGKRYEREIDTINLDLIETKTRLNRYASILTPMVVSTIQRKFLKTNHNQTKDDENLNEFSSLEAEVITSRCLTKVANVVNKFYVDFQKCFELTHNNIEKRNNVIHQTNLKIQLAKEEEEMKKKKQAQVAKANAIKRKSSKTLLGSSNKSAGSGGGGGDSTLTLDDVKTMKVAQLRSELLSRDLPSNGLKADLAARLSQDIQKREAELKAAMAEHGSSDNEEGSEEEEFEDCELDNHTETLTETDHDDHNINASHDSSIATYSASFASENASVVSSIELIASHSNVVEEAINIAKKQCDYLVSWKEVFEEYLPSLVLAAVSLRKLLHVACNSKSEKATSIAECLGELTRFEASMDLIVSTTWSCIEESSRLKTSPHTLSSIVAKELIAPNLAKDCTADRLKGAVGALQKAEHRMYDEFSLISESSDDDSSTSLAVSPASFDSLIALNSLKKNVALVAITISQDIISSPMSASFTSPNFIASNKESYDKFTSVLSLYKEVARFHQVCEGVVSVSGEDRKHASKDASVTDALRALSSSASVLKSSDSLSDTLSSVPNPLASSFVSHQLTPMPNIMADFISTLSTFISPATTSTLVSSSTKAVVSAAEVIESEMSSITKSESISSQQPQDMMQMLSRARQVCSTCINGVSTEKSCDRLFDSSSAWRSISLPTLLQEKSSSNASNILAVEPSSLVSAIGKRCYKLSSALLSSASFGPKLEEVKFTLSNLQGEKLAQERELRTVLVQRDRYAQQLSVLEEAKLEQELNPALSLDRLQGMTIDDIAVVVPQVNELKQELAKVTNDFEVFRFDSGTVKTGRNRGAKSKTSIANSTATASVGQLKSSDAIGTDSLSKQTSMTNDAHTSIIDCDTSLLALRRARAESATWRRRACQSLMSNLRPLPCLQSSQTSIIHNSSPCAISQVRSLDFAVTKAAASVQVVSLQHSGASKEAPLDLEVQTAENVNQKTNLIGMTKKASAKCQVVGMTVEAMKLIEDCESIYSSPQVSKLYFRKKYNYGQYQANEVKVSEESPAPLVGKLTLSCYHQDSKQFLSISEGGGKFPVTKKDLKLLACSLV